MSTIYTSNHLRFYLQVDMMMNRGYLKEPLSTCITDTGGKIGKTLSLSTGAKITGGEMLGDHIVVVANSVVTKSFPEGNVWHVGMPVTKKTELSDWYSSLNEEMKRRVDAIENLKIKMRIQ